MVTGAAGFIGSHLAETLLSAGHGVVGIDCFTDYYDPALKEENLRGLELQGLELQRIDLAEDELDLGGFDAVFHLAARPGVRSFGDVFPVYLRDNVLASQRVFEAAARDGSRVVFASSSSVYGAAECYPTPEATPPKPISPYGDRRSSPAKHLAAAYTREFGLDCVVLRYFNAFGPRQRPDMAFARIVNALAAGTRFEVYGDGDQSRGWTYVADIVEATIAAAGGRGTYNVGGAVEASLNESIAVLEQISGRTLDAARQPAVPGDQRRTSADTTRICEELGWIPRRSRSRTVSPHSGSGPRLESQPDEHATVSQGSRRRA